MATKNELEAAVKLVRTADASAVKELDVLIADFEAKLNKLRDKLPDGTPVSLYMARVGMTLSNSFGFELTNLRNQYAEAPPEA